MLPAVCGGGGVWARVSEKGGKGRMGGEDLHEMLLMLGGDRFCMQDTIVP